MSRDPRVDAYIAGRADFARPILAHLRGLMHDRVPDIGEAIKWGMPFFTLDGRPLANMAAFKRHATFGFWNRAQTATGREGEAMGQLGRIASLADLPSDTELGAMIVAAAAAIADGTTLGRAARPAKPEAEVPPMLAAALAEDTAAMTTWRGFPPSCRREYCEWIGEAKRDDTRAKRTRQTIAQLHEGKRHNWQHAGG